MMVGFISKLSELLNKTNDILIYLNFTLPYTEVQGLTINKSYDVIFLLTGVLLE